LEFHAIGLSKSDMERKGSTSEAHDTVAAVYRSESRRVFATLVRLLGDFDLAEEALHEAFASAVEQ
jgi:RNA polymerase sigma-70 factor (ECF subfamily)